jgi:hypothetical protein
VTRPKVLYSRTACVSTAGIFLGQTDSPKIILLATVKVHTHGILSINYVAVTCKALTISISTVLLAKCAVKSLSRQQVHNSVSNAMGELLAIPYSDVSTAVRFRMEREQQLLHLMECATVRLDILTTFGWEHAFVI